MTNMVEGVIEEIEEVLEETKLFENELVMVVGDEGKLTNCVVQRMFLTSKQEDNFQSH